LLKPSLNGSRTALLAAACAYLLLLPTGALSFWRSLAFAASAVLALMLATLARSSGEPVPSLGKAIPIAIGAWATWSAASIAWSVDRAFSLNEVKGDVVWGLVTMAIFYVAATQRRGFELLGAALLAGLAFWTAVAIGFALSPTGWDLRPFHRGEGAFATYVVTVAPFLALLLWPPPLGYASGARSLIVLAGSIALLLVAARMSENRIVWVAFAASLLIVAALTRSNVAALVKVAVCVLLIVVFAGLFVDASRHRAEQSPLAERSVGETIVADPRLAIWKHAKERISDRPWLGYGYGLHILGREIGADTGDAKIRHPHNVFASQWLQTGAIGAALFVVMFGCVAWRFVAFVRSGDDGVARLGAIGLAVLAAFVIRNLTDDFFLRANGKILFAACAILLGGGIVRLRRASGTG
jgi:O-antigen ligase